MALVADHVEGDEPVGEGLTVFLIEHGVLGHCIAVDGEDVGTDIALELIHLHRGLGGPR